MSTVVCDQCKQRHDIWDECDQEVEHDAIGAAVIAERKRCAQILQDAMDGVERTSFRALSREADSLAFHCFYKIIEPDQ